MRSTRLATAAVLLLLGAACTDPTNPATVATRAGQWTAAAGHVLAMESISGYTITLQQLPDLPGGGFTQAFAINNAGEIVGESVVGAGGVRPVLWGTGGAPVDLGLPAGVPYGSARFITDSGYIAGATAFQQTALGTPIQFRPGAPIAFPGLVPPTGVAYAWSVNNTGILVGSARNYTYPRRFERAVRWVNGQIEDLGVPNGMAFTLGFGINDTGDIVGQTAADFLVGDRLAFVWRAGVFTLLPTLGGTQNNIAYYIHNNGNIVGTSSDAAGAARPALWQGGQVRDLGAPVGSGLVEAFAVNATGMAVGHASPLGLETAVLFANGQMVPLPQPPLGIPQTTVAYGVNDAGQIVGSGYVDGSFIRKALLWTVTGSGNRPPVASMTSAGQGFESLPISFDGSQSFDPDGDPLTYAWAFGDGSSGQGKSASHVYRDNGAYTASLTVRDPGGLSATNSQTITVNNAQPTMMIVATSPISFPTGGSLTVRVTIGDPGVNDAPWQYRVEWGDGSKSQGQRNARGSFSLSHRYSSAGSFSVTGMVRDKDLNPVGFATGPTVSVR
ncbi:MAG: PKD domain-containing protein [Gemmatimonadaceae bacterium]